MTIWDSFAYYSLTAVAFEAAGAWAAWRGRSRVLPILLTALGIVVFLSFIIGMWAALGHPPMRTLGETRMWYAFLMPVAALPVYWRRRYRWILAFSTVMALVFVCINIFNPGIHDRALMPALQSAWFAPHVIVYMMAYALMGAAAIMAVRLLLRRGPAPGAELETLDSLVCTGLAFLTAGMLFGALWAKEAWGHYWSWDPKETWAAATWLAYLVYVHMRLGRGPARRALWMSLVAFALLQMCWWGINYLPAARDASMHTYG